MTKQTVKVARGFKFVPNFVTENLQNIRSVGKK